MKDDNETALLVIDIQTALISKPYAVAACLSGKAPLVVRKH